jgi:hypothetical protein
MIINKDNVSSFIGQTITEDVEIDGSSWNLELDKNEIKIFKSLSEKELENNKLLSVSKYNEDKSLGLSKDILSKYDRFDVVEELVIFSKMTKEEVANYGKIFLRGINFKNKVKFINMSAENRKVVVIEDCTFKSMNWSKDNVFWLTLRGNVTTNKFNMQQETILKLDSCKFTCPTLNLIQLFYYHLLYSFLFPNR